MPAVSEVNGREYILPQLIGGAECGVNKPAGERAFVSFALPAK